MEVQVKPVRMETVSLAGAEHPPSADIHAPLREQITRLDQDVSLLRNRSQITAKTRARMDALTRESADLSARLPEIQAARTEQQTRFDTQRAEFARGHALYTETQAPALTLAQTALRALTDCTMPPVLERSIIALIADLDHHDSTMRTFTASQGVPAAMQRLMYVHTPCQPLNRTDINRL